jgi:hypothetical protein
MQHHLRGTILISFYSSYLGIRGFGRSAKATSTAQSSSL